MDVTPSSIITDLILSLGKETISVIFLLSISLPIVKWNSQLVSNTSSPISVALFGMIISCKSVQPSNAPSPIEVTLSGMDTSFRLVQPANA